MILQFRADRIRLFRQHDHALSAGRIAAEWRQPARREGGDGSAAPRPLPFRLVLAVGLHDVAWRELDRVPALDPESGRPYDFQRYPLDEKLAAYRDGIDRMAAVDPWVGLLGSLHYASFLDREQAGAFLEGEGARRRLLEEELLEEGAVPAPPPAAPSSPGPRGSAPPPSPEGLRERARRHLRWLKFFDTLSLRLCLAPPAVSREDLPGWLDPDAPVEMPEGGGGLRLSWKGEDAVEIRPGAIRREGPLELEIPYRDLPRRRFGSPEELEEAWREAGTRIWRLRLEG